MTFLVQSPVSDSLSIEVSLAFTAITITGISFSLVDEFGFPVPLQGLTLNDTVAAEEFEAILTGSSTVRGKGVGEKGAGEKRKAKYFRSVHTFQVLLLPSSPGGALPSPLSPLEPLFSITTANQASLSNSSICLVQDGQANVIVASNSVQGMEPVVPVVVCPGYVAKEAAIMSATLVVDEV